MKFYAGEPYQYLEALVLSTVAFTAFLWTTTTNFTWVLTAWVAAVVGSGIILHELAHKYVAQRYGMDAVFVANTKFLLASAALAVLGFLFLAPGAVYTRGATNRKEQALVAWAGPATNLGLTVIFAALGFIVAHPMIVFGTQINALLFGFNMIPFPGFDGAKILRGYKTLYYITAPLGFIALFVGFSL